MTVRKLLLNPVYAGKIFFRNVAHPGPHPALVSEEVFKDAGADWRDPTALPPQDIDFLAGLDDGIAGLRIGFSADLGYAPLPKPVVDMELKSLATIKLQ